MIDFGFSVNQQGIVFAVLFSTGVAEQLFRQSIKDRQWVNVADFLRSLTSSSVLLSGVEKMFTDRWID